MTHHSCGRLEISNTFNNYFINVGVSLQNKIIPVPNCSFTNTSLTKNCNSSSFFLRTIGVVGSL